MLGPSIDGEKKSKSTSLSITRLCSLSELESIRPEWHELYTVGAGENPFASPDWLIPWAQHFVPEQDLAVLAVRRGDMLVGLAPWYVKRGPAAAPVVSAWERPS